MSLREALRGGIKTLREASVPSPELAAELLLMHVLGCDRTSLHSHSEREVPAETVALYFRLIDERLTGKPTQYIIGHQEFWGLDFEVTPDVLIPRPETECLVEAVLDWMKSESVAARGVDVGTGSGCIALALASELPSLALDAVDISSAALGVAARNARRLGLEARVRFRQSDLLAVFLEESAQPVFDFVVSNPPYVGRDELDWVQREVKEFEPRAAWGGLENPDELYRRLFSQANCLLRQGGLVAVEIGWLLKDRVTGLLGEGWTAVEVRQDLSGIPRVVTARRAA